MPAIILAILFISGAIVVITYAVMFTAMVIPFALLGVGVFACVRNWQKSPERQERLARKHTVFLYETAKKGFGNTPEMEDFFRRLYNTFPKHVPEEVRLALISIAKQLYADEKFGELPEPPAICNSEEGAAYRDFISEQVSKNNEFASDLAADTIGNLFTGFINLLPEFPETGDQITIPLENFIDNEVELVDYLVRSIFGNTNVDKFGLFKELKKNIQNNIQAIDNRQIVMPKDYKGDQVVLNYLGYTSFEDIFQLPIKFGIPLEQRFEAMWVLGRPGSGKTQFLQWLLTLDLELVVSDAASVVVIDGHGDLIKNIRNLKIFAKGQPLEDKLVIIEPSLEHPPALNLFDIGRGRLDQYTPTEREMMMGVAEAQFVYIIEAMLGEAGSLTPLQAVPFGYITRLLFQIPGANLSTFSQILGITSQDKRHEGLKPFQQYIDQLSLAEQDFFRDQFYNSNFDQNKLQIGIRIAALRKNQFFESMFGATKSKIDMFDELNSSKVFIVNTNERLLGEYGTNVFGRYFIASILTAAQERAILERDNRKAAFIYVDEAHDYMAHDAKVATIIDQCRKMRIGLIASHQRVNQMDNTVKDALGNAAIKFANTDNASCLSTLTRALHTDSDFISFQPDLQFAVHFKGLRRAFNFPVTAGVMEALPVMTKAEKEVVQKEIWEKYTTSTKPEPEPDPDDIIEGDYTTSPEDQIIYLGDYTPSNDPKIIDVEVEDEPDDGEPGIFPEKS